LFAGYLVPLGSVLVKTYFLYQDAGAIALATRGRLEVLSRAVSYPSALFVAYVSRLRVLGSYCGFGAIKQSRIASQSLRIGLADRLPASQTDTMGGSGYLIDPIVLNWQ